jgi:transcriptional regulator with XRE-family HTH domain
MSKQSIAKLLKEYRKKNKFSVNEIIEKLKLHGISLSAKTLYGYENGVSSPDVDTFMLLCIFYGIKNFDSVMNDNSIDEPISQYEKQLLVFFRQLNSDGQESALTVVGGLTLNAKYVKKPDDTAATGLNQIIA